MIDQELSRQYSAAVQARGLLRLLPEGVREYALQFETLCLEDIRAQTGNPNLTQQEILEGARPTIIGIFTDMWPLISQITLTLLKKYFPAVATTGALSAVITYLTTK